MPTCNSALRRAQAEIARLSAQLDESREIARDLHAMVEARELLVVELREQIAGLMRMSRMKRGSTKRG